MNFRLLTALALTCLVCHGTAAWAEVAWNPRLQPDDAALESLLRDERWSLVQAQEAYGRKQWKAAAALYQKFTISFLDSRMWNYAAYRMAECQLRDEQLMAAIKTAGEIVEADAKTSEAPEALLLVAYAQRLAGRVDAALLTNRRIINEYPTTAASTPARLEADECMVMISKRPGQKMTAVEVAQARLSMLAPATDPLDLRPLNQPAINEILTRLVQVALDNGDRKRIAALITSLAEPCSQPDRWQLAQVRDQTVQRGLDSALWADDDAGLSAIALATWPDAPTRALGTSARVLEWAEAARRRLADWAKELGREPAAAEARIVARIAAVDTQLLPVWKQLPAAAQGDALWTLVRAKLLSKQVDPALQLLAGGGATLDRGAALHFTDLSFRAGNPFSASIGILQKVTEGIERQRATMDVARYTAQHTADKEAQKAATIAIAAAQDLETTDAPNLADYLRVQAELQRWILHDLDAAMIAYGKLNQPPVTDMSIAECLQEKNEPAKAMAKYVEIHALYMQTPSGPQALLRAGLLAHKPLDQKARATELLRRVCDDYPNSGEYSQAHQYLQLELGVTYTGGGGERKK